MTPIEYLKWAEHFAQAAETAVHPITRSQLEAVANSYFMLAKSTAILERSRQNLDIIKQRQKK